MRRAVLALVTLGIVGSCVEARTQECGGGYLCPMGTVCTGALCVLPQQIDSCEGHLPGDSCTYADQPPGICVEGICRPPGCGNGFVEAGEACDDGNVAPADGCSSDCRAHWSPVDSRTTTALMAVWGNGPNDAFALGYDGDFVRFDGSPGSAMVTPVPASGLWGVWSSGPTDVFAVGVNGWIGHFDGSAWSTMDSGTGAYFRDVWGLAPWDVFAVGVQPATANCTILRLSGGTWTPMTCTTAVANVYGLWASGPTDLLAVGSTAAPDGVILHSDGSAWSQTWTTLTGSLYGIWGSGPADVFAVGNLGTILHFDGSSWSPMLSGTTNALSGVWGSGPSDVFAVGVGGTILHFDGSGWSPLVSGTSEHLWAVWGSGSGDVFAVGDAGTILVY